MKAKIAILTVTLACLGRGADSARAQQPYPGGGPAYPVPAAAPGYGPPGGYPVQAAMMPGYGYPATAAYQVVQPVAPAQAMVPMPVYPAGSHVRLVSGGGLEPVPAPVTATPSPAQGPQAAGSPPATLTYSGTSPASGGGAACDASGSACDDCGQVGDACVCREGILGAWCRLRAGGPLFDGSCANHLSQWHDQAHNHLHDGIHSHLGRYFNYPRAVRVWGGAEALWWWNKDRSLPVLATTSTPGTPFDQAGVLGEPNTRVLFGGGEYDGDASEGIRGTLGFWLDRGQNIGVFARVFQFGEEEINYRAESSGNPILARPFFDVDLGVEDALVVAYPGIARGGIDIQTSNEARGYDLLLRKLLYFGECNRLDLIGGYHSTEVDDDVQIAHRIISIDPDGRVPVGTQINTLDSFKAENEFHGGSIGVMTQGFDGRLTWNMLAKVSFGNNRETVTIRGNSTTTVPGGGSASFDQGLLALDSNSGVYERDEFAIVPELDLSVMYNICSMLSVSVGYSAIYWTDIALAGPAVNTAINPTQIGGPVIGPALPVYSLTDDDFWLHGLTFGVHGRF